jgi:hypothetical protein
MARKKAGNNIDPTTLLGMNFGDQDQAAQDEANYAAEQGQAQQNTTTTTVTPQTQEETTTMAPQTTTTTTPEATTPELATVGQTTQEDMDGPVLSNEDDNLLGEDEPEVAPTSNRKEYVFDYETCIALIEAGGKFTKKNILSLQGELLRRKVKAQKAVTGISKEEAKTWQQKANRSRMRQENFMLKTMIVFCTQAIEGHKSMPEFIEAMYSHDVLTTAWYDSFSYYDLYKFMAGAHTDETILQEHVERRGLRHWGANLPGYAEITPGATSWNITVDGEVYPVSAHETYRLLRGCDKETEQIVALTQEAVFGSDNVEMANSDGHTRVGHHATFTTTIGEV